MHIRLGKISHIGDKSETTRDKLLAAIARSAEELTAGKGWPGGVVDLLADLGLITGVSRVWIFQTIELGTDYIVQDYPFEWADKPEHAQLHMPVFNMFRNEITDDGYRAMVESRTRGEWQSVVTSHLSRGWLRSNLEQQGILSMLTIPIMVEGQWWGTLGFDDCEREYEWGEVEVALLRTAAYLISNAIIRDRLAAKTRQFSILQNITESSAWELNLKNGHLWCSTEIIRSSCGLSDSIHMNAREMLRLIHPADRKGLFRAVRESMMGATTKIRQDLRVATQCGDYAWVEMIGVLSFDSKLQPEKLAGIAVEIRQRKEEEQALRSQARRDALTGVGNRAAFDMELSRLFRFGEKDGKRFALLIMDLDRFKDINDRWGHEVGDRVLRHFIAVCRRNLRRSDHLSRIGGEEFALLLRNASEEDARATGERIRKDLEASPLKQDGQEILVTVSIGCAEYPSQVGIDSPSGLYQLVDYALYAAKRSGRNRLVALGDLDLAHE